MAKKCGHLKQSIDGPLMNWTDEEWQEATTWTKKGDGTSFKDGRELKRFFLDAWGQGKKTFPMCDCDEIII